MIVKSCVTLMLEISTTEESNDGILKKKKKGRNSPV